MKRLFLMFIFLSAFVSCGEETKETDKCDGVSCNDWEQCNSVNGFCEAKSGRCNVNRDCAGTNICDANHNCVNPDNPCEGQTCSSHGTCVVENNSAKCNCETGYHSEGLTCIVDVTNLCENVTCDEWKECNSTNGNCELKTGRCDTNNNCETNSICDANHNCVNPDNPCENQTCSSHGTCIVENNSAKCNCETGYHSEGLNCIVDVTNLCENVTCDEWKECNSANGNCELKTGRCDSNNNCETNSICDANHNCVLQNPCENQTCSSHGTCVVENNSAKCNCEEGFVANSLSCEIKICEEEAGQYVSCGEDGEKQHQICTNNQWVNDGVCNCVNSTTRTTVCQGDGVQYQTCVNGSWTNLSECVNTNCSTAGEIRSVVCGFNGNGTQNQVCVNSKWTNTGTCADPDECANGTMQVLTSSCGILNLGDKTQICAIGQWVDFEGNCFGYVDFLNQMGTSVIEDSLSIVIDNFGNAFITGYTWGGLDGNINSNTSCSGNDCYDIFLTKFDNNGNKLWTKQWGSDKEDYPSTTVIDNSGNVYVTGYTIGGFDGNSNIGGCNFWDNCPSDIFLTKFDNNGNKLWTKQWGSTSEENSHSIVIDNLGNIFVTGFTSGGLDENINSGSYDIFLTKFDNNGNKLWTKQWGTRSQDKGYSVVIDNFGNIFVTGYTSGGFDGNINTGLNDIFLTKFDNDGNKFWTKQWGTNKNDNPSSIIIDSLENIFVTGSTYGGFDGNTNIGIVDIFLTKFDNNGNKLWTKQSGSEKEDYLSSTIIDSLGNIYMTGVTFGGFDGYINNGQTDIFLTKFDNNGNKLWSKQWGTILGDSGNSIGIDTSENIFVIGNTGGGLDGNVNKGGYDIFLTKFDNSGNKLWTKQWGTILDDSGNSIGIDNIGNIFITGSTQGSFDGTTNANCSENNCSDVFLIKFLAE